MVLRAGAASDILNLNIKSLRTGQKRTALDKLPSDLQIEVCVLSETHVRLGNLDFLNIPDYQIIADYCRRTPAGDYITGGVHILAQICFAAGELPNRTGPPPHIEHCSCTLYPTGDPATALRASGVHIPPFRGRAMTLGRSQRLSAPVGGR